MDAGASVPVWGGRRATEALQRVKAEGRRRRLACVICRQPIDYGLEYPHPQSCSVQHLRSRKLFPHLTWDPANWAPAHLDCNMSAGTGERAAADLGLTSQEW